jgi:hypothetical protein
MVIWSYDIMINETGSEVLTRLAEPLRHFKGAQAPISGSYDDTKNCSFAPG